MKAIESNYSLSSCDGIINVFEAMFPGALPKGMSLGQIKAHYLLTYALGPYFEKIVMRDIHNSCFTLSYDETTNNSGRKELQTTVRYWSEQQERVTTQHLQTFFLGKATAEVIYHKLQEALDTHSLSLKNLLMLGSDGPNVNKKVARLMNEAVKLVRNKPLVDIGSCNIHVVHNAFLKGIHDIGEKASDLILGIYKHFNVWPSRWDAFCEIQEKLNLPKHHFIIHCPSRWLSIENAAERLLEQWDTIQEYFLKHIPAKQKALLNGNSVRIICNLLRSKTMKSELLFICSSAKLFTRFTGSFQRNEPLIHVLHTELKSLLKSLAGRVCTLEATKSDISMDSFIENNLLPLKKIVCGDGVMEELQKASEIDQLVFLKQVQSHYVSACKHIVAMTPVSKSHIIRKFRFLHPEERTNSRSSDDILAISKVLPLSIREDELADEWRLLQLEKMPEDSKDSPIDEYWKQFFILKTQAGDLKYPNITAVVKAALSFGHGNADIECKFSCSKRVLTEERASMSEQTLNAIMMVKDVLKLYKNKPHLVPITEELLNLAKAAQTRYMDFLEEKKRRKQAEQREKEDEEKKRREQKEKEKKLRTEKESIEQQEEKLKEIRHEENRKRKLADSLVNEAEKKLKQAVQRKDFYQVAVAHAILEKATTARQEGEKQKERVDALQKTI